jgi:hypothetical protein
MRFSRQARAAPDIEKGARFQRQRGWRIVETAHIIDVVADSLGVPHVRFSVGVGPRDTLFEHQRTLSLESFRMLYKQTPTAA